jgi:Flp pilus assembly protein TadD
MLMNGRQGQTAIRPLDTSGPDIPQRAGPFFAGSWPIVVLLLLSALPYLGLLRNDFTYIYDDKALILDSPYVHNFQHLREVLTTTLFSHLGAQGGTPYYRPVATLGFLLCYQLFGSWALGFHLISLLLNAAVVAVLFLFAQQLLGDRIAAFAAASLFALHPVHVEAVAWISSVTDLEVTLFYLLTFWCFWRVAAPGAGRRAWTLAAMTGSFVLAILSKEPAATLPVLAVVYEHFYRADRRETTLWQKIPRYGPLWLVCLGYLLLRVRLMGAFTRPTGMHAINATDTLLSAFALLGQYIGKLFWPARLSAFYPFHASTGFFELPVLGGVCALALCTFLFAALWKRARPVSLGLLWLFITLVPVLNARWMSAYALGERYLYLPSVGFCLVAGGACALVWEASSRRGRTVRTAVAAAACVLVVLSVLRIGLRVLDWRSDITLLTRTLAAEPNDARLHEALGLAYWIRGESGGAEREWRETLHLDPNSVQTLDALGGLYAQQQHFDQAIPLLERALALKPNDAGAHLNLGAAFAQTGKLDRAEDQFRVAVLLSPMNFNAHNLLGKLYFDSKRLSEAEQQFRQSLACEPNLAAYDHLGYIYMQWGDRNRAEAAFKAALGVNNTDSHAHFNLGLIYAAADRNAQAVEEMQAARAADPNNPEILSTLEKLQH